jgi:hypothetical protein
MDQKSNTPPLNFPTPPSASEASATTEVPPSFTQNCRTNRKLKDLSKNELIRLVFRIGKSNMDQYHLINHLRAVNAVLRAKLENKL